MKKVGHFASVWALNLGALFLVLVVVSLPIHALFEVSLHTALLQEVVALTLCWVFVQYTVYQSRSSAGPLAWKSLGAFVGVSAAFISWVDFGEALLQPLLPVSAVTPGLVVLLCGLALAGGFCFAAAMRLVREIGQAVFKPDSLESA